MAHHGAPTLRLHFPQGPQCNLCLECCGHRLQEMDTISSSHCSARCCIFILLQFTPAGLPLCCAMLCSALLCCAALECIARCCVADRRPLFGDASCWEPVGVHASDDGADVACPVSLIEWFLNFYKDTQKGSVRPLEGICRAGEVLFVPRGWWHMAMNLEVGHMSL